MHRPSIVPALCAGVGLALVVAGALLPWVYLYGDNAQNGFEGGWVVAHLRLHFDDAPRDAYPVAWQWGADAWITIVLSIAGLAVAIVNRRVVEQRYDRLQFALGLMGVAVALYNIGLISMMASEHRVTAEGDRNGGQQDALAAGLWLSFAGGVASAIGALLGNTPEFRFEQEGDGVELEA